MLKTLLLNPNEHAVIEAALAYRVEYFQDLLDNYEGFGPGIEDLYKSELKDAEDLLERVKEL